MKLGYFTMPMHPLERNPTDTLREDREAIILADKLGFHDAFVGEHLTERSENITNSLLFLATLISETKTIKLATGTTNLSQQHPVIIASNSAMFDHIAQGRFIFGISAGALRCDAEALGNYDLDRNKMFEECIDVILEIWKRDTPYDIDLPDNRFKVSTARTRMPDIGRGHLYKPFQQPRPEIVGTVVAPFSKGVIAMDGATFTRCRPTSCSTSGCPATGRITPRASSRPVRSPTRPTGASHARFSSPTTTRSHAATPATTRAARTVFTGT